MFSFNNDTPIYLQIVDIIRNDISSGKLKPGQKLPSVREYALEFKVNPNTICKAMQILEDKKIIYTHISTDSDLGGSITGAVRCFTDKVPLK